MPSFEDRLERRLETEAFSRREISGEDDVLDFFVGHFVNVDLTCLSEAAEFLAELRREFGTAAAYNAGPGRVRDFIDGRGGMPAQTRHYVRAITGRSVEEWAALGRETRKKGITKPTSCGLLTAVLKGPPSAATET